MGGHTPEVSVAPEVSTRLQRSPEVSQIGRHAPGAKPRLLMKTPNIAPVLLPVNISICWLPRASRSLKVEYDSVQFRDLYCDERLSLRTLRQVIFAVVDIKPGQGKP